MTSDPARSLHRKLAQIMYEAERIPKRGKAPAVMGGFPFVQVGDAADYIRKALAEHQVSMLPSQVEVLDKTEHATKAGGSMTTVDLRVTWTLTDGESGETATIQSYGAGGDGGDKYSGKATTSAMKYALLAGFLLSTGDDVELSDTTDRQARRDGGQPPTTQPTGPDRPQLVRMTGNDGLIGKVATSGTSDFNLRQTPDGGFVLPFRIKEGNKAGQIVVAEDDLAVALEPFRDSIMGQRVTVWGRYSDEESPPKADGYVVRYKVLHLSKIQTPDWVLPSDIPAQPNDEQIVRAATSEAGAVAVAQELAAAEASSVPLFDDDLSDVPDAAWVASEESDAGGRR